MKGSFTLNIMRSLERAREREQLEAARKANAGKALNGYRDGFSKEECLKPISPEVAGQEPR